MELQHVLYHFVTSLVCMIAALAYLVMALMSHGFLFAGGDNDVTWVHYVDWLVTTPMLLIDLGSESFAKQLAGAA